MSWSRNYRYIGIIFCFLTSLSIVAATAETKDPQINIGLDEPRASEADLKTMIKSRAIQQNIVLKSQKLNRATSAVWKTIKSYGHRPEGLTKLKFDGIIYCIAWGKDRDMTGCD